MSEYVYATDEHKGHWLTGEEIVRCRDCKWFAPEGNSEKSGCFEILHPAFCDKHITKTEPDGFCAWAERRTNDN